MARPNPNTIRAAQAASTKMADRQTPFIFDEWYVAAFPKEIGRSLLQRTLLGRRLVFFRTEAGEAVALDDRCPHRSFPLSSSTLDGDTIVCGYHGLRYDSQGDCIEVPSAKVCPKGIGTRSYPLVEQGKLIWIWMGDPAKADPSRIPDTHWIDAPNWTSSALYLPLPGSYVRLHENLMDLTHLSFLHINSFGTPDYAPSPYDVDLQESTFALTRSVVPTTLPDVWAKPTGITSQDSAARITTSRFVTPAFHLVSAKFYDIRQDEQTRQVFRIQTAHLPTPETETSTHYFIVHGRDFVIEDEAITHFMHEQLTAVFEEDVWGLGLQEEVLAATADDDLYEMSIAADGPAIAARRYLKRRAEEERAAATSLAA